MARRYKRRIDWKQLRSITETSLNDSGKFAGKVNVDGKMEWIESGLNHDNYRFRITGTDLHKEWKEKPLMLRINSQKSPLKSADEAGTYFSREVKTLQQLKNAGFRFQTPELICTVSADSHHPIGLIETWIRGIPLKQYKGSIYHDRIIPTIAEVAVSVHQMEIRKFGHLKAFENSKTHILDELASLAPELFKKYAEAFRVKEWILSSLPENRPSVVLHGDLLPQNILCHEAPDGWQVALVDWEFAEIGDPASDLAIVTRGDQKLIGIRNGLELLLKSYRRGGGAELSATDIRIHELLLCLNWLQESAEAEKRGRRYGHGPEHYEQRLKSILRRAKKSEIKD
jgi:aminoglycoside phosphotransferase (APT) family kinase protein